MSVCTACVGFGVHTALFGLIQSGSVTEGFKPCWRTGPSARLETILLLNNYICNPCLLCLWFVFFCCCCFCFFSCMYTLLNVMCWSHLLAVCSFCGWNIFCVFERRPFRIRERSVCRPFRVCDRCVRNYSDHFLSWD